MVSGLIQWLALIVAVLGIIKIVFITFNKRFWFEHVVRHVYGKKTWTIIFSILTIILFYYLLQSYSIVEIFGIMAFSMLLVLLGLQIYGEGIINMAKKLISKPLGFWPWVYLIIWLVLSIWVLVELF